MAEQQEEEAADVGGMQLYKVTVPRFALILVLRPFHQGKLQLPEEFAEEHGAELANEVVLKLPNGAKWPVSVLRSGQKKKIWFGHGWREFAEFYSLKPTHFLVFELADHNHLKVMIFDKTATEIDYSKKKSNANVKSECNAASNQAAPSKAKENPSFKTASGAEFSGNGKRGNQFEVRNRSSNPGRPKPSTADKGASGGKANAVFEFENPSFVVVIQQTHLLPGSRLVGCTFCKLCPLQY